MVDSILAYQSMAHDLIALYNDLIHEDTSRRSWEDSAPWDLARFTFDGTQKYVTIAQERSFMDMIIEDDWESLHQTAKSLDTKVEDAYKNGEIEEGWKAHEVRLSKEDKARGR